MVSINNDTITISFQHPCADEAIKDIQNSIITLLQNINFTNGDDAKEIGDAQYFVLELLKSILDVELIETELS